MNFLLIFALTLLLPVNNDLAIGAPDFAADGTMVVSLGGDLYLGKPNKNYQKIKWTQLTNGPADDRDVQWLDDNNLVLFASNRNGNFDLWTLDLREKDPQPKIWQATEAHETQPTVADNGTVVWVNGIGPKANLWIKSKGEVAEELTQHAGMEGSPAINQSGTAVLYVFQSGRNQEIRFLPIGKKAKTLIRQGRPEFPSWSPDGQHFLYTTRGNQSRVWISNLAAQYQNVLSQQRALGRWTSDGKMIVLSGLKALAPYHNGDQDIAGARYLESPFAVEEGFLFIPTPNLPDEGKMITPISIERSPQVEIEQAFDALVARMNIKYQQAPDTQKKEWGELVKSYQDRLKGIESKTEGEALIYQLIKERPYLIAEKTGKAGVSSAHPLASAAGTEILTKGGNVVDAAIAVSFALGVVEPDASGIGGYGEMLIYLKGMESPTCIEFLTRVPEAASLDNGALNPLPQGGPIMVNIPGTVAGMELAWQRYGSKKVKWADILAPAIRIAKEGFLLDDSFPTTLFKEQQQYRKYPSSKLLFFKNNEPLQAGDLFKNPDLAWTLEQIAQGGAKAFYRGIIAKKMVKDLRSQGNVMTMEDMSRYYAVERKPVQTTYHGHTVYAGPPPVSGGANLIGQLNQLAPFNGKESYQDDPLRFHALIEAWKMTPSGRGKIADPGLWPVDLSTFHDKAAAQKRWMECFNPDRALMSNLDCQASNTSSMGADKVLNAKYNTGTTAFAVADAEGNMVSVTQTLGTWGGNFYVSPGLGFLYNDKLGSYSTNPKSYNARVPFARNVTSITPTLVFKGEAEEQTPLLAVGAAGNAWITAAVYQIVTGVIDQGLGPQAAIEQPRFLVGARRSSQNPLLFESVRIQVENGFAPGVLQALEKKGHNFQIISNRGELRMGYAAAIKIEDGKIIAGGDPRRSGKPSVISQ